MGADENKTESETRQHEIKDRLAELWGLIFQGLKEEKGSFKIRMVKTESVLVLELF